MIELKVKEKYQWLIDTTKEYVTNGEEATEVFVFFHGDENDIQMEVLPGLYSYGELSRVFDKYKFLQAMGRFLSLHFKKIHAMAHISEGWMAHYKKEGDVDSPDYVAPSKREDKQEALIFSFKDDRGQGTSKVFLINRGKKKVTLKEMNEVENATDNLLNEVWRSYKLGDILGKAGENNPKG